MLFRGATNGKVKVIRIRSEIMILEEKGKELIWTYIDIYIEDRNIAGSILVCSLYKIYESPIGAHTPRSFV